MDHRTEELLERWEEFSRNHPGTTIDSFLQEVEGEIAQDAIARFRDAVEKIQRMNRRLKQIGVDSRDSD
jgi:hypothetical protein